MMGRAAFVGKRSLKNCTCFKFKLRTRLSIAQGFSISAMARAQKWLKIGLKELYEIRQVGVGPGRPGEVYSSSNEDYVNLLRMGLR
jgi:hypothetical protein